MYPLGGSCGHRRRVVVILQSCSFPQLLRSSSTESEIVILHATQLTFLLRNAIVNWRGGGCGKGEFNRKFAMRHEVVYRKLNLLSFVLSLSLDLPLDVHHLVLL